MQQKHLFARLPPPPPPILGGERIRGVSPNNIDMIKASHKEQPPKTFRPLLWSLKWEDIDVNEDKEDIILNTINEGRLDHWRWIIKKYGKETIRRVLKRRLDSEFHPESRNLAKVVFSLSQFRHARKSAY